MKRYLYLPDGTFTKNENLWHEEWSKLYKPIAEHLDCKAVGWNDIDQTLSFAIGARSFHIPISVAQRIIALIENQR